MGRQRNRERTVPKPLYMYDYFDRANSTSTVGLSTSGHTWTPVNYTGTTCTWGISSNRAYLVTQQTGYNMLICDPGMKDYEINARISRTTNDVGLVVRYYDSGNAIILKLTGSTLFSVKMVSGATGDITNSIGGNLSKRTATPGLIASGEYVNIRVVVQGNNIYTWLDGNRWTFLTANTLNTTYVSNWETIKNSTKCGLCVDDTSGSYYDYFIVSPIGAMKGLFLNEGFEDGTGEVPYIFNTEMNNIVTPYRNSTISTAHVRSGSSALRLELRKSEPEVPGAGSYRCELKLASEIPRQEYWYCISIYLPGPTDLDPNGESEEFLTDYNGSNENSEILLQWHSTRDSGDHSDLSPSMALLVRGDGNYWLDIRSDTDAQTLAPGDATSYFKNLGSFESDKGNWVDWVFHVRWGWLPEHATILEIYKNGTLLPIGASGEYNRNGYANTYNDVIGVYWKLGIYRWIWTYVPDPSILTKRIVYYDDVKIYDR